MGKEYEIYPMLISKLQFDQGIMTYLDGYGKKIWVPIYSWYIRGAEKAVLVDTGTAAADYARLGGLKTNGEEIMSFEDNLARFGLQPSDIGIVIITHLHGDHYLNTIKCTNARVIVQKRELDFAHKPHPMFAGGYRKELWEGIDFESVDGDKEILPSIEVILTPGHTMGGQSVSVSTRSGRAVISGLCTGDEGFGERILVPGHHVNPLQAYDSMVKLKEMADVIIPLHSWRFQDGHCVS